MQALASLPGDFVWGAATSAYQIEGAHDVDGRAPSIWDTFCRQPGAIDGGDTGDVACDHYHRWPEDLDLLADLGVDAYRFSVGWPRVIPDGVGAVNRKGLDFYQGLVDGLLARGIVPFVTLYHWDLPHSTIHPASDRPEDVAAAGRGDGHTNRWWLDPIHGRGYPEDMIRTYGVELPLRGNDLAVISEPLDYLGANYYKREVVRDNPSAGGARTAEVRVVGAVETAMGWEVHPQGLRDILVRVADEYGPRRIYMTENGSAWSDRVAADGCIDDVERAEYLDAHIDAVAAACRRGAPVAGYFVWSLLDNFEWAYGYDKRFGVVGVDFRTQRRTVKTSGGRFAGIIARHRAGRVVAEGRA